MINVVWIFICVAAVGVGYGLAGYGLHLYRSSTDVPDGWYDYLCFKIDYDQKLFDERLAANTKRWEECKAIEEEAYRKQDWEMETLWAWWELFCNRYEVPFKMMYGYPLRFRKRRAIFLEGSHEQWFFPELPEPLPSPQLMWWTWEEALISVRTQSPVPTARLSAAAAHT